MPNFLELRKAKVQLRRTPLQRLYEKASSASQSPQQEATHGSVHENASLVALNFS